MRPAALALLLGFTATSCSDGCPREEPESWRVCMDGNRESSACGIVIPVETGALTATERFVLCDGVATGPSACGGGVEPMLRARPDGLSVTYPTGLVGDAWGDRFLLEYFVEESGTGVGRFCRVGITDVGDGSECWPSDWECATSGTIRLNETDPDEPPILEYTAVFGDGGTVTGAI